MKERRAFVLRINLSTVLEYFLNTTIYRTWEAILLKLDMRSFKYMI